MLQIEYTREGFGTEELVKSIDRFPLSIEQEFLEWQSQDMHRQFPNIRHSENMWGTDSRSYDTLIWPRSRAEKWKKWRPRERGRRRVVAFTGRRRPILRAEMFEKLRERMRTLLSKLVP